MAKLTDGSIVSELTARLRDCCDDPLPGTAAAPSCPECMGRGVVVLLTSSSPCSRGCKPPAASPTVDDVIASMRDVSNYRNDPFTVREWMRKVCSERSNRRPLTMDMINELLDGPPRRSTAATTPRPNRYVTPGEFINLLLEASSRHRIEVTTIHLSKPGLIEFEWKMGRATFRMCTDQARVNASEAPGELAEKCAIEARSALQRLHMNARSSGVVIDDPYNSDPRYLMPT